MSPQKSKQKTLKRTKNSIDYSDIPKLNSEFWRSATLTLPEPKAAISLRVDRDVLNWFKAQGKGYQSLMNAVLRSYAAAKEARSDSEDNL